MSCKDNAQGVSIIIPTLNEEKYIRKLLDSLAHQTYRNFEIIVVDGGSRDNTVSIIETYKKLNLKVANSHKDLSFNRNLGVRHAANEHILFLDADVILYKDYLSKSLDQISKNKAYIATSRLVPIEKSWYNRVFISICNSGIRIASYIKPMGYGCCLFTRKSIHYKIGGWDASVGWGNDLNYVKKSSKFGKFTVLDSKVRYSMRRFEKYGTKETIKKFISAFFYTLLDKDDKISKIQFEFGDY
jgi:glycosyltransferase involved in cell wall biosynthesis